MPVPGYWIIHRKASKIAKPATTMATIQAHGCSDQRPSAAASQRMPPRSASQPQSPTCSKRRHVAEQAEPVEAEEAEAEEQPGKPGEGGEEAEDRDQDGRVLHVRDPSVRLMDGATAGRPGGRSAARPMG